jgi:methionine aminopeptidase
VTGLNRVPPARRQYSYAYALNTSRNEVVCHGVPSATDVLRGDDIVNFDITPERNGYIADSSKTYRVGEVSTSARRLVQITYEAMWKGIEAVRPRARLGEAGPAIGCLHMGEPWILISNSKYPKGNKPTAEALAQTVQTATLVTRSKAATVYLRTEESDGVLPTIRTLAISAGCSTE